MESERPTLKGTNGITSEERHAGRQRKRHETPCLKQSLLASSKKRQSSFSSAHSARLSAAFKRPLIGRRLAFGFNPMILCGRPAPPWRKTKGSPWPRALPFAAIKPRASPLPIRKQKPFSQISREPKCLPMPFQLRP